MLVCCCWVNQCEHARVFGVRMLAALAACNTPLQPRVRRTTKRTHTACFVVHAPWERAARRADRHDASKVRQQLRERRLEVLRPDRLVSFRPRLGLGAVPRLEDEEPQQLAAGLRGPAVSLIFAAARWPPASAAARLSSSITKASSKVGSSFCAPASIYASFSPRRRFLTDMRLRVSTKASAKNSRQSPQMPHTTYSSVCVCPVTGCGRRGSKSTMQPGKGLARASDELARGRTARDAYICQKQVWRPGRRTAIAAFARGKLFAC